MTQDFWHPLITEQSFEVLRELRKQFDFILIGGWAVYFYTHNLKSKDIDLIVDLATLGQLKQQFEVSKNERLKKYEIKINNVEVDIYVPYWSDLGLKVEEIMNNTVSLGGFKVPAKEILLILKLVAYQQRKTSLKGRKDLVDIISLLSLTNFNWKIFKETLENNKLIYLNKELEEILLSNTRIEELAMNSKKFSELKKRVLYLLRPS